MRPTRTADRSASYAVEVARLLWPEPWDEAHITRTRQRSELPHRDAYLFPNKHRPRLLVPADLPGSARMLQRLGSGRGALAGPARCLLERTVRSRAFALAQWPRLRVSGSDAGADSIETYLAACFGIPVRVGVMLGTPRVNQKPVLQVFDVDGQLLGYAKVGHNDLTAALVRREVDALTAVGVLGPVTFRAPRLLHHGRWRGLEVLVISALPVDARRRVSSHTRLAAMREVVHLGGTREEALTTSSFWNSIEQRLDQLGDQPWQPRLRAVADDLARRHGDMPVELGGWHGDWGHWNMGMGDGVLQVWDWERYDPAVPVGFDALHFAAQSVRPGERDAARQEEHFLRAAPTLLAQSGVDRERHPLTLQLYLLEISARYVEALTHGATSALQRRVAWAIALLERVPHEHQPLSRGRS